MANNKRRRQRRRRQRAERKENGNGFGIGSILVLVIAVCVFAYSLFRLIQMAVPYYSGGKEYDKIKDLAIETTDNSQTGEEERGDGFSVDFDALLKENADTVAWIRFE